ncbi:MAG: Gfo/Idh/MocA family protein [Acetobacteraceae bacterium]
MANIGWGLVGTSGFAESDAAPAIKAAAGAALIGAVGSAPENSQQFQNRHGCPRSYMHLAELAADPEVSIVWVAGPNHLHSSATIELLKAGKHVLVEKPMAISVADAEAMLAAAARSGSTLRIGYHQRFRNAHRRLRQLVLDGELGKIGSFRIHLFIRYPALPAAWRRAAETSGGWAINDIGTHLIDLMLWMTGLPAQVLGARLPAQRFPVATDDGAAVLFGLGQDAIGIVETSTALASPTSRIEIYGDKGWARADGTLAGSGIVDTSAQKFAEKDDVDPFVAEVMGMHEAVAGKPSLNAEGPIGIENVRLIQLARKLAK